MKTYLTVFMLAICASFMPAVAKTVPKTMQVGFIAPQGRSLPVLETFRQGFRGLGYVEGTNIALEPRFAEGQYDRIPALLAELVNQKNRSHRDYQFCSHKEC